MNHISFLELQPSLAQEIGRAFHHQRIPSGGSTEPLGADIDIDHLVDLTTYMDGYIDCLLHYHIDVGRSIMLEYIGIWMDTSINPLIFVGICWNTYYGLYNY